MKKYFSSLIFSLLLIIALVIGGTIANAAADDGCCPNTGGSCIKRIEGVDSCLSSQVKCDSALPRDSTCDVKIAVPDQVKITDFGRLFSGAVSFLLLIAFILAFFYLILGGIAWLTSGGDKANIETARNKIISAIIGLIIVAATWALFQLIGGAIGFNILGGFELPTLY